MIFIAADVATAAGPLTADDFSLQALFLRATPIVQGVIVILALCSVWSWAVIIEKSLMLSGVKRDIQRFEDLFWSGEALNDLYDQLRGAARSSIEKVFAAGMREWERSSGSPGSAALAARDRIDRAMMVAVSREAEGLEKRLSHLATIGATTPFIGLFGTVWGIKTSFEAIALTQDTNIAVVAPGIAEALFATALGLFAAIPAVIAYNQLVGVANGATERLENFSDEFSAILSRQLESRSA